MMRFLLSLRNIPPYLKQSSLQAHTSVVLLNSKDSSSSYSSSSDSSDSDSDKEDKKPEEFTGKSSTENLKDDDKTLKTSDVNERLNILLHKINEASQKRKSTDSVKEKEMTIIGLPNFVYNKSKVANTKSTVNARQTQIGDVEHESENASKTVNVAIKPKKIRFRQMSQEEKLKEKPIEHQIKQAAKNVAESLGGDTQKTELELLTKALNWKQEGADTVSSSKQDDEKPASLSGLLSKMKVEIDESPKQKVQKKPTDSKVFQSKIKEPSIAESVLFAKSATKPKRYAVPEESGLKVAFNKMGILKKISEENKDELQMPIWNTMESRELKLSVLTVPKNSFQELIQWTNEGKIWHFPIDNEQGMEEENDVHFSEHVFMERHLKDWCPRKGPIRHFMELVCTGLSKNAFMTVEEKVGHITWYKNYFEDKKELLHELGVLDDKTVPISPSDKKKVIA